jgi:hypothetical protein
MFALTTLPIIDSFTPTALSNWSIWYVSSAFLALYLIDRTERRREVSTLVTCLMTLQILLALAAVFIPRPSQLSNACAWGAVIGTCAVCVLLAVDTMLVVRLNRKKIEN